jgi:HD superfamily phosphodiesterase
LDRSGSKIGEYYYLRPGMISVFKELRRAGCRLVLWTGGFSSGDIVQSNGRSLHLSKYFDLIISQGNNRPLFLIKEDQRPAQMDQILTAYRSIGYTQQEAEKALDMHKEYGGFKDITLLGYDMIVDDSITKEMVGAHPRPINYLYYQIQRFNHFRNRNGHVTFTDEEPINQLAQRIKTTILASYLKKLVNKLAVANEEFNRRQAQDGKLITYVDDVDHGSRHAADLLELAYRLAESRGLYGQIDWKVLIAAIALHDIFAYEDYNHAPKAEIFAREFLKGELTQDQINKVVWAIRLHDKRTPRGQFQRAQAGLEAQILFDIDQLEAFGYKGIYRFIAVYARRHVPFETLKTAVPINAQIRFNSLFFEQSRAIADQPDGYPVLRSFFEEFAKGNNRGSAWAADFIYRHESEDPVLIAHGALHALYLLKQSALSGLSPDEIAYAIDIFRHLETVYYGQTVFTEELGDLIRLADAAMKMEIEAPQIFEFSQARAYFEDSDTIADNAMRGGIDLNSANLNLHIKRDGKGMPILSKVDLAQLSNIEGLNPVILSIKPASSVVITPG